MNEHDYWITLGVPATLVHAYSYCVSQSIEMHDDWDYASLIIFRRFSLHIVISEDDAEA